MKSQLWGVMFAVALSSAAASALTQEQERPLRRITLPALVQAVGFAPDGQTLTAWDPAGLSRWVVETGRQVGREPVFAKACERVTVLPRASHGVIGVNCRSRLLFFDVATGRGLGEWKLPEKQTAAIFAAAANGRGTAIVMPGATTIVGLGDLSGGKPGVELQVGAEVEQLSFSADGNRLAVGTSRGVEVREVPGGALLRTLEGYASHAISADGRTIPIVTDAGARLVNAETGETIRNTEGRVSHLQFGPGDALLVGWTNQRLIVWEVASGARRLVLNADEFVAAAISPDGTRLATLSLDRRGDATTSTIAVWRLR